jgi:DNA helicase HerA-like ATPase
MAYEIIAGRSPRAKEKFGLLGTILIGKQYVQMGQIMSLSNPVYLDVGGPHIILVSGKRGSGKSYTLGVIAEGLARIDPEIAENISTLIFDTLGIFWTMKYPNYRDDKLLSTWDLRAEKLNPVLYVPVGLFNDYQEKGVPVDIPFALKPAEITGEAWCEMFEIKLLSPEGTLIERTVDAAKTKEDLDIDDLIKATKADTRSTDHEKNVVENRFLEAKKWGLFSPKGTKLDDLFKGGQTAILDLSAYSQLEDGQRIKALVIGLISKRILEQRMSARKAEEIALIEEGGFIFEKEAVAVAGKKAPLVWIMIDEAHEFLPHEGQPPTLATRPLIQLLREGRQPGISVILATQQPGKIHTDVMTQSDIILSHRVTAKIDIDALNQIASTYLPEAIQKYIDSLPAEKGTAILIDDKLEKIYPMRVRPRFSWHGGEDPTAIRSELVQFKLV